MCIIRRIFFIALLSLFSFSAHPIVIEQAPLDSGDGSSSSESIGTQIADDFSFSNNMLLTGISWWGSYFPSVPSTELFTVRVFEDNGAGSPETTALFETSFSGSGDNSGGLFDFFSGEVFRYDVSSLNWLLTGGESYYLSIFSNDLINEFFWLESASGSGEGWSRAADSDAWTFDSLALNTSFRLTADSVTNIPVPTTLLLILLPLVWLGRREMVKK